MALSWNEIKDRAGSVVRWPGDSNLSKIEIGP